MIKPKLLSDISVYQSPVDVTSTIALESLRSAIYDEDETLIMQACEAVAGDGCEMMARMMIGAMRDIGYTYADFASSALTEATKLPGETMP